MNFLKKILSQRMQRYCTKKNIYYSLKSEEDKVLNKYLSEIPSETSIRERLFLYWLAREWVGKGIIVELGPFLGGTTRALALGAEDNFNNVKIVTIDRFKDYYTVKQLSKMGVEIPNSYKSDDKIEFRSIFNTYHEKESYFKLIETVSMKVADNKLEISNYDFLPKGSEVSALFIDGCKSWYSLIDFVGNLCKYTPTGSYYIFQDYGRFTCFWVPVFTEIFKEYFSFVGSVDSTYTFKLVKPIDIRLIKGKYKDTPNEMSFEIMTEVFNNLKDKAISQENYRERVILTIQESGYLAYIGNKIESKNQLVDLLKEDFVQNHLEKMVKEALISPTYNLEGPIYI
jgi:hypothetical protein